MELDKKDAEVVNKAIQFWESSSKITPDLAEELRKSYQVRNSNVDAVAIYALISAISCGLLAFGSLVIDEKWIELLRKKWGFSETIVGIGFSLLALLFVVLAKRKKAKSPDAPASNETYNITIALTIGVAITYWTRSFANFGGNYALPLLLAAVAYGIVAVLLESKLLWLVMIVSLAGWWGAQTHYWSGGNYRFAGMNYPLRMTVFGLVIWGFSWIVGKVKSLQFFADSTYSTGLLLFLIAAWSLSVFGNYDDLDAWTTIKQSHFWYWSLGFTLVLAGMIAFAFQNGNDTLRDLALVFFLLNIYTRYFEYFWDRTNKGIFFAILALSFWFVGRKAEQWRSKEKKTA
ncbi:hypothetical protein [Dyadobacter psychrotolerans]|uniref:DUF2157 domain-containing protein n=1 Tax=Dyadobacter psychrotolerans TaxID=2541721 RepID=A0A4R5DZG0_9BACT|nr:hypothetical protein [Dyadobacter psychrotolerans]TDE16835.1 hypothetical protein E0F88_11490 [Dyadobacter psychrotolerans]